MRYRLEVLDDDNLVVHNVETGLILGSVIPEFASHPDDPGRMIVSSCTVLSNAGGRTRLYKPDHRPKPT